MEGMRQIKIMDKIGRNVSPFGGVVVWDAHFADTSPVSHVILIIEKLFLIYICKTRVIESIQWLLHVIKIT